MAVTSALATADRIGDHRGHASFGERGKVGSEQPSRQRSRQSSSTTLHAGLLAAGTGADASPVTAEKGDYRPADAVPATWQAFARQLRERIEQRLAGDDERARRFQDYLTSRSAGTDAPPVTLVLRTWVSAGGQVQRVELSGINDPDVLANLRALLTGDNVGTPPSAMLQPLHMRLSLRATDRLRQGK